MFRHRFFAGFSGGACKGVLILEQFASYLKTEKKVSTKTAESYIRDIRLFSAFLGRKPTKATEKEIRSFILHLQSSGYSNATTRRMLSSLHAYYLYLSAEGKRRGVPTKKIERPVLEHKLPVILTTDEANRLLSAPSGDTPLAIRDRAMLELLYATGITVSELIGLDIENINLRRRTMFLRRHGQKRLVPFGKPAASALSSYLKTARPLLFQGSGDVALFVSAAGTRMSRQGFWKILKKYKDVAGIDKEITPHMLRHSFAAHLLENGADVASIQEMMGFVDPASMTVYTQIIENKLMDVYKKTHPRAN